MQTYSWQVIVINLSLHVHLALVNEILVFVLDYWIMAPDTNVLLYLVGC